VPEHVIRHAPTLGNASSLVERPMDSQVNTALAVFLLRLGKRREILRESLRIDP
jgi:hypothetical protein